MKQFINRNTLWTELFVTALENLRIKHASISPGSRSTPLTIAFQKSKKIKSFVHIDERSNGFFALGLANRTKNPVLIVTTSGTAVAELYPSIIEAYQQKIPIIICTADRPSYLQNTGANQTINQKNIFQNHIINSYSLEEPSTKQSSINSFYSLIKKAYTDSVSLKGPVHINFPFEKPFEPTHLTDEIEKDILIRIRNKFKIISAKQPESKIYKSDIDLLLDKIKICKKRLIMIGPLNEKEQYQKLLFQFAKKINAPILTDGLSGFRFGKIQSSNLCVNYSSFFRSKHIIDKLEPELIIQIGLAPTSNSILEFYKNSDAYKIIINEFGELKDPSRTSHRIIKAEFNKLFDILNKKITKDFKFKSDIDWHKKFINVEKLSEKVKHDQLTKVSFPFEGKIVNELVRLIPDNSNIMISNSLAVRDFDAFASSNTKKIGIFSNRGASGIDGIISTSAGICAADLKPTFLIIGDLAFYHDITGLLSLKKYAIPLTIILLNNNGGGIFEFLPIAKEKIDFHNYFKTPTGIDFRKIVKAFGGSYSLIKNWNELQREIKKSINQKTFSVMEVKITSEKTLRKRKQIWKEITKTAESLLNES